MRWGIACALLVSGLVHAALGVGERAPVFTVPAALAGKVYEFSLAEALAKGPVVVYFFPAAFTTGCSAEAHAFAEAMPRFAELGASVIGVSGDDVGTLAKFSVQVCQNRFPVASDASRAVMKSFDAVMPNRPDYANRVTYVIAPDAAIVYRYTSSNPERHVENSLAALREWAAKTK